MIHIKQTHHKLTNEQTALKMENLNRHKQKYISRFGLLSLRSGGASSAANHSVSDRLLKMHGRWVTDRSKDGYIKDNSEKWAQIIISLGYND
jgi:hypothetical protein